MLQKMICFVLACNFVCLTLIFASEYDSCSAATPLFAEREACSQRESLAGIQTAADDQLNTYKSKIRKGTKNIESFGRNFEVAEEGSKCKNAGSRLEEAVTGNFHRLGFLVAFRCRVMDEVFDKCGTCVGILECHFSIY